MQDPPIVRLHHNEGDYLVGEILNPTQIRVLDSKVAPTGLILTKCTQLTWAQAEESGSGGSLVSPYELVVWNEAVERRYQKEKSR